MIKILKSKLLTPQLPETIQRERLFSLLSDLPNKKLTTLVAGAGFGKTTLLAQTLGLSGLDTVWYRLDSSDKDFLTFLSYLINGFKAYFPDFGTETQQRIEEAQLLTQEQQAVLTYFVSEIEKSVQTDMVVVLDDYHLIQDNPEINNTLAFLLEHTNDLIHLVIISRVEPTIPISRLTAKREVISITEKDLCFTLPETQQIFQKLFFLSLEKQSLESLVQKTGGWISGLILFYHFFRGKNAVEIGQLIQKAKGTYKIISRYLEENVFDRLPRETKEFLVKSSTLFRVNADFCDRLLNIKNSRKILNSLEENHLFTFPVDEERNDYYYHHLFQDFLQAKLQEQFSKKEIVEFHTKAGDLWEAEGEMEAALGHFLPAENFEKSCQLLNLLSQKMLKEGRFKTIEFFLEKIPEQYLNTKPWLLYAQGRIHDLSGRPKQALTFYAIAYEVFQAKNLSKGAGLCLNALSNNFFQTGDFVQAQKNLEELLQDYRDDPRLSINIITHLIFITSHLGELDVADDYFEKGKQLAASINEKGLLESLYLNHGFRFGCSGEFDKALQFGLKAKPVFEECRLYHQLAFVHHLISWSYHYIGLFEAGYESAKAGLQITREKGFKDGSHAWLLMDLALNATALGNTLEAIDSAMESLDNFTVLENRWGQAYCCHVLQIAYSAANNLDKAGQFGQKGLDTITGLTLPIEKMLLKAHLANLLMEKGNWKQAGYLIKNLMPKIHKFNTFHFHIHFLTARLFHHQNNRQAVREQMQSALKNYQPNLYDFRLILEKPWAVPLLLEAFTITSLRPTVLTIFKQLGVPAVKHITPLEKSDHEDISAAATCVLKELDNLPSPGLRVYCLGKFEVYCDDKKIPENQWFGKKTKTLFKYLIHRRHQGYIAKEELMELLWPDGSPDKASHRLQVALSSLRKTLEPAKFSKSSSYLIRKGSSYCLDLGENSWLDIEAFEKKVNLAKDQSLDEAIPYLREAEKLYRGDYLAEDIYDDWCSLPREKLKESYQTVLNRLITYFEERSDFAEGIETCRKYLKTDEYAENIYQHLMKFYAYSGNRSMMTKTYQRCREQMKKGYDISESEETRRLFQRLKENSSGIK